MENKISLQQYKDNLKKHTVCYDMSDISSKQGLYFFMTLFMEHQRDTSIVLMAGDKEEKHLLVETIVKETVFGKPSMLMEEENIGIYLHAEKIEIENSDGNKMVVENKEKDSYKENLFYGGFFNLKNKMLFLYQQEKEVEEKSILHSMKHDCFGENWIVDLDEALAQTFISKKNANQTSGDLVESYKIMEEIEEHVICKNKEKLKDLLFGTHANEMKEEEKELRANLRGKYEEAFTNTYEDRLTKTEKKERQKGELSFLQFLKKMYLVRSEKKILGDISKMFGEEGNESSEKALYDFMNQKGNQLLGEGTSYREHILMERERRKIIAHLLCDCNNPKEREQYGEQAKKEYAEKLHLHMPFGFFLKASIAILLRYDIETIEKEMLTEDEVAFIRISDAIHDYKKVDFMKDPIIDLDIHTKNIFHQDEVDSIHAKVLMGNINGMDVRRDDVECMAQHGISVKNTLSNCVRSFLVYDGNSYQSMLDNENLMETCIDGIPWRDVSSMRVCDTGKTTLLYTNEKALKRYQEYKRTKEEKGETFFHGKHVNYDDLIKTIMRIISFDKEVKRFLLSTERNTKRFKNDVIARIYFEPNTLPLAKLISLLKHQLPYDLPVEEKTVEIPKRNMGILGLAMREEDIKALAEEIFQSRKSQGDNEAERGNTVFVRLPMEEEDYVAMATVVLKPKKTDEEYETPLPVERIFVTIQRDL